MDKTFFSCNQERISLLISNKENEIFELIYSIIYGEKGGRIYTLEYIEQLIDSYIFVSEMIGEKLPYRNTKEFFSYCSESGLEDYYSFWKKETKQKSEIQNEDKLTFLLTHTEEEICRHVNDVLNDSDIDPHFSAVYAVNMIKCFICIANKTDKDLPYNNVDGFLTAHGFSPEQNSTIEHKRKEEAVYYSGIQY